MYCNKIFPGKLDKVMCSFCYMQIKERAVTEEIFEPNISKFEVRWERI